MFFRGEPLVFARAKTKELLAYLVDRSGGECTAGEIEMALWEDPEEVKDTRHYSEETLEKKAARHTFKKLLTICQQCDTLKLVTDCQLVFVSSLRTYKQ